jgi:hypothetical protein
VSVSPYGASTSAKAVSGTVKVKARSSVAVWSAIGLARVGASLVFGHRQREHVAHRLAGLVGGGQP